jgi:hypothetical protein
LSKTAYPDKKKLVIDETNNMLEKLTQEFGVSPTYSCIQTSAYCVAQLIILYKNEGKTVPKELEKFLNSTYPKLLADNKALIEEQFTMLNTDGTA